ncbi:hypothetical protein BJ508DRAFT_379008 [Ascobolus immersus RN42]|uniref:Cora-domain-containing protein n=1 Tax=Ascobolus immersus RN42 TaxID=1160509 RepID=A0A3N4HTS7_ASCIM|nr:hypothetical protein BJ508DRAFT_379008 [Ascobolus immersus RN42]
MRELMRGLEKQLPVLMRRGQRELIGMAEYAISDLTDHRDSPNSESILMKLTQGVLESSFTRQHAQVLREIRDDLANAKGVPELHRIKDLLEHSLFINTVLQDQLEVLDSCGHSSRWESHDFNLGHLMCCTATARMNRELLNRTVSIVRKHIRKNTAVTTQLQQSMKLTDRFIRLRDEKNNQATFVFTGVTTIFLPLSVITGYFGMNTRDIRDMDGTSTLYWIWAISLTAGFVIVIIVLVKTWPHLQRGWKRSVEELSGNPEKRTDGVDVLLEKY